VLSGCQIGSNLAQILHPTARLAAVRTGGKLARNLQIERWKRKKVKITNHFERRDTYGTVTNKAKAKKRVDSAS
jgi:hypothetical protein